MSFFTLKWTEDRLLLIDQLKLPGKREIVTCTTGDEAATAIKDMVVRGAPAIGVTAAYGLVLALRELEPKDDEDLRARFGEACKGMAATRPTAVNLFWAIERMKTLVHASPHGAASMESLRSEALAEAQRIEKDDLASCKTIGKNGADLVPSGARILTHCNAGALATAGYGTALGVIRAAHEQGKLEHAWVDETRPYLQGARLTAWELGEDAVPYTLICDNMAASIMQAGRVDLVVVGADRIAANGDVANKIGTYGLAVLCHYHGIPFYAAAPWTTVDMDIATGKEIAIEERPDKELTCVGDWCIAPDGAKVYNPAFDVTPHKLVTALITDKGVLYPPFGEGLRKAAR